jgi:methyl-accepting chemotaxis protein
MNETETDVSDSDNGVVESVDIGLRDGPYVGHVLDCLSQPALVTDPGAEIVHLNEAAADLYGVDVAEAVGRPIRELRGSMDDGADPVSTVIETGSAIQDREERIEADGAEYIVSRTVEPIFDEEGALLGAFERTRDVSEAVERRERLDALESYQRRLLDDVGAKLDRLAQGDLTIDSTVPEPDRDFEELQDVHAEFVDMNEDLHRTVDNFTTVVGVLEGLGEDLAELADSVSANTEEITGSIDEIDDSSEQMAEGTERLASQTQRIEENVSTLSASVEEITSTTQELNDQSDRATEMAEKGVEEIDRAVDEIRDVTVVAEEIGREVSALQTSMEDVNEITEIIADIADQTNLLALNASIEAANAGEAGEGFAVVANEVKSLAEDSQDSTDEIRSIVSEAQEKTEQVAEGIEKMDKEIEEGAEAVESVVDRLERIDDTAEETSHGVSEITDALDNQAQTAESISGVVEDTAALSEQISASIQQISSSITQQSAAMDETAQNAQQLTALSDRLQREVGRFRLEETENATLDRA